jgi:hypothetical protein
LLSFLFFITWAIKNFPQNTDVIMVLILTSLYHILILLVSIVLVIIALLVFVTLLIIMVVVIIRVEMVIIIMIIIHIIMDVFLLIFIIVWTYTILLRSPFSSLSQIIHVNTISISILISDFFFFLLFFVVMIVITTIVWFTITFLITWKVLFSINQKCLLPRWLLLYLICNTWSWWLLKVLW